MDAVNVNLLPLMLIVAPKIQIDIESIFKESKELVLRRCRDSLEWRYQKNKTEAKQSD